MWDIDWWQTDLRARKQSEGTVRLRGSHVRRFARSHPDPWQVTSGEVAEYLAGCRSPEYAKSVRSSLSGFYIWAIRHDLTTYDPTVKVGTVKVPRPQARPCPEGVYKLGLLRSDSRVQLMLLLMGQSGLRCMEVSRVHTRDVDGDRLLVHGKGGHARWVALSPDVVAHLRQVEPGWVFPGRDGGPMRPATVGKKVAAVLGQGWTAHTLRHRCGTTAYAGTSDLVAVQQLLGHASVATTQRYIGSGFGPVRAAVAACS